MNPAANVPLIREIMLEFASDTGLAPAGELPRRYLWTDAFAVCNFLGLFLATGDETCRYMAVRLVHQVHDTLGRHRGDDRRTGWISGLGEDEGPLHPTRGGLRIGKEMNERGPDEPPDEQLEWERDGQYFHYLTKWMHALSRVARITGDPRYLAWGIELAGTAHARFTHAPRPGARKRLCWKMSIDLTRPLVASMGQHDPLDGLITFQELRAVADRDFPAAGLPDLNAGISDFAEICRGSALATDDPLGIGGLLSDAWRIVQLMTWGKFEDISLLEGIADAALLGLESFTAGDPLRLPASYRLPFRELGLAIGLKGVGGISRCVEERPGLFGAMTEFKRRIGQLSRYAPLAGNIEEFWLEQRKLNIRNWQDHRDINMVMLATSLSPDGFLNV